MIELYVGAPGSFKSYHATARGIYKISCYNRNHVIANYPIKPSKKDKGEWLYIPDDKLTPELLILRSIEKGYYGKESSCLLIIDEAGIFFNSRDWQIAGARRKEWIKFFALSRHYGYDVILIAQDERMVDRQIRSLAEFTVKHVNLKSHKWVKWLVPPFIKAFVAVSFWSGGRFRGNVETGFMKPWIANRYDTIRAFDPSPEILDFAKKHGIKIFDDSAEGGAGVPSVAEHRRFNLPSIFAKLNFIKNN